MQRARCQIGVSALDRFLATIAENLNNWLSTVVLNERRPKTYQGYEGVVRFHRIPGIGKKRLAKLTAHNGLSKDEPVQAITHLAFYAGWPNAMSAMGQLKQVTEG